jgi:16S rRNA U516 pseudouridylate synthase RsuA-like enzyme
VTFSVPCHPRTEQLVSRQLALSRRQCKEAIEQGLVQVEGRASVPKRLAQPSVLLIDLDAIARLGAA